MLIKIIIISIVLFSLILSLWKVGKANKARTVLDFFLANKKIDSSDFINTTVSYGYQIAALSLFASWGYLYGFWAVWVPIFWGLGFYLLRVFNNKGYLDVFYENHNNETMHGFIAEQYNYKFLAKLTAFASILGLSGTAFFEAEFTGSVMANTLSTTHTHIWAIALFLFFVLVVLGYILWGGLKTITITNKVQLDVGFFSFNLFVVYIFIKIFLNGYVYTGIILFALGFISLICLNLLYPKLKKLFPNNFRSNYSWSLLGSLFVYIIGVVFIVTLPSPLIKDNLTFFITAQNIPKVFILGALPMLSLLLANGLWQIVDVSTWQRLSAINGELITKKEISKSLDFIAWYSSITWFLAILFGMGLKYVGFDLKDAWTALQTFTHLSLTMGNVFDKVFVLILFLSMLFIMFSTLDSIISAISFTTYFDIISQKQKTLKGARIWTVIYTLFFGIIYYVVRKEVSTIDGILYTFYSFQLSLFPAIIFILLRKKCHPYSIVISIISGFIGTLIPLFINSDLINPYSSAAIFSIIFSIVTLILSNKILKGRTDG